MMEINDIESNDNWVFLLGAGFSAPYGCPVMNNFMETARRTYFTKREQAPTDYLVGCYKALLDFQAQCLRSSWAFNRNWENIEELYTQADLLRLANQDGAEERCTQIAWVIWDVYRKSDKRNDPLPGIVHQLRNNRGLRPVFITTNYDIIIEKELSVSKDYNYYYPGFKKEPDNYGGCWLEIERGQKWQAPENEIPIIKLHGSVNWFQHDGEEQLWFALPYQEGSPDDPTWLPGPAFSRAKFLQQTHERTVLPRTVQGRSLTPAIIPPMLGKASVSPVIATQWSQAIEAFRRARQIWIIGYSFPATDTFMKRLLSQGIQQNPNLQKIVIIDRQLYTDWEARLADLFPHVMLDTRVSFFSANSDIALQMISPPTNRGQSWDILIAQATDNHILEMLREKRRLDPTIII